MKPDYSEYLTPPQLAHEERLWEEVAIYKIYGALVRRTLEIANYSDCSVLEIGCGTGWVPTQLPSVVSYTGLDKNPECLARARAKNPKRSFIQDDLREFALEGKAHVVCSFAVLKHFGLAEWDDLVHKILGFGNYAVFTLPVWDPSEAQEESYDDGVDFPHVWIGRRHLKRVLERAGHEIVETGLLDGTAEEWFITKSRG